MDSVRYFEFDFVWRRIASLPAKRYLDVSSPRLLPLLLIHKRRDLSSILLNPDSADLPVTRAFAHAFGVEDRCQFSDERIESAGLSESSVDVITCISVLEHIPADRSAVRKIWSLLRPGGRLCLTVPCAAKGAVEYVDRNAYGLLAKDEHGFVFWQRYYDSGLLRERIYEEIGAPASVQIYGERVPGSYAWNVQQKMGCGWQYPGWREPYFMGRNFRYYESVESLPGMGVIGLEFRKP